MSEAGAAKTQVGLPAWVMTFADLMSLLLAFFVLLFSFSEMDKNVYKELAGSLKDAFGVQREVKAKEAPKGINIIAREFSPGVPVPTPYNEVRQYTTDDYRMHPVFTDPADEGERAGNKDSVEAHGAAISKALEDEIRNGLIDLDVRDKRIILRIREKGSFPSGSSSMMKPFKAITGRISEVFRDFEGTIIVSGHTDNVPISTRRFRSNWELSSSRAVSVLHELSKNRLLMKKQFQIAAYADTQPLDTNDTPEGRARNRRVEIMLDYSNIPDDMSDAEPLSQAQGAAGESGFSAPVDAGSASGDEKARETGKSDAGTGR